MVKTLEEKGIGRPSTYSPTITTILERRYIEKEQKQLVPTELGKIVNKLLCENFADVINVEFTAKVETEFDNIAEGQEDWKKMIGEFFGATHDFEYNIGDKLYEFAIMSYEDFDKLKTMYTGLIELVCSAKEANIMDEKLDCFFKMFQIVRACLEFSPYTHFYTQVLIDIIENLIKKRLI